MKKAKKIIALLMMVTLVLGSLVGCGSKETTTENTDVKNDGVTLNALFMKQAGYSEDDVRAITEEFEKSNPDINVELNFVSYESLEQKILTSASAGGYDVALIDAPWTAKFAKAGIVKNVTDKLSDEARNQIFKGALDAVSYEGKLYGMPWLNDTKYLFYNKKMLKEAGFEQAPKTWDELLNQAKVIKEKGIVEYPMAWSWAQAEALVCDYTSLAQAFGGDMIAADGTPQITKEENKKALDFMVKSIKEGLTNPSSTEFLEEDVRGMFSSGQAAFALNWTYMYNLAKDEKESSVVQEVGIAVSPGQGDIVSASVNGGMGLAITEGSKNVDAAWKYIEYLSSKDVQKQYAKNALPIWKGLYDDQEVIDTNPEVVNASKVQYEYLANRPQVAWYGELSTTLQVEIQQALLGEKSVDEALEAVQVKAEELSSKK